MPTVGEILDDAGNLIDGINTAFAVREPIQDQLGAAQRDIQMYINSLRRTVVEVHARYVTEYRDGEHPDQEGQKEQHQYRNVRMVMLVMEVEEASASRSLNQSLRLRGLKLGPRAVSFPWVQV